MKNILFAFLLLFVYGCSSSSGPSGYKSGDMYNRYDSSWF